MLVARYLSIGVVIRILIRNDWDMLVPSCGLTPLGYTAILLMSGRAMLAPGFVEINRKEKRGPVSGIEAYRCSVSSLL